MVHIKSNKIQFATGLLPVMLSIIFLVNHSWIILLLCILSMFIVIATVPLFKHREILFMFVLVAATGLPINIGLSCWLISEEIIGVGFLIGDILWGAFICCALFSAEEILFGVMTRILWKKQYKIKI